MDVFDFEHHDDGDKSHYHLLNVSDSEFIEKCYLKIGNGLKNETNYIYSDEQSMIAGVSAAIYSIVGLSLNSFFLIALYTKPNAKTEYITPSIISLALNDALFSALTLPMLAGRYFVR